MPMVGVSCLERRASAAGKNPLSAIPSSWKLSLLISASNCPTCDTAAAATTHHDSQLPPTCRFQAVMNHHDGAPPPTFLVWSQCRSSRASAETGRCH